MLNEIQELCFKLEDIDSIEDNGYENTVDITVTDKHDFILANGFITHNSALSGLMPCMGRDQCGYFTLKGKPLNSWDVSQSKFTSNKELSSLYQIIKNETVLEDKKDGEWFKLTLDDGSTILVNENDRVKINNDYINVTDLLKYVD